jgi:hypothetical protein
MIKMVTAFTNEVDVPEIAIEDIRKQIKAEKVRRSAVAIIQCHPEFIETGVMKAVCEALPFETVGITCSLAAVTGSSSQLTLTVTLLTSDECEFKVVAFESKEAALVPKCCKESAKKFSEDGKKPALVLSYLSLLSFNSGDKLVSAFSEGLPGVPIFGTLPVSDEIDFSNSYIIHNGKYTELGAAFIGIYGNINPTFILTSVSAGTMYKTGGILEKSDGTHIYTISGMSAWDYIVEKGIVTKESYQHIIAQPLVLTNPDGSVVMRNLLNIDFDNKSLSLSGDALQGAIVDFALINANDVRESAKAIAYRIAESVGDASVVLMHSCVTRLWTLGTSTTDEIDIFADILKNKPYSMSYSGGEIYPLMVDDKYINTFQNNNLIVCVI